MIIARITHITITAEDIICLNSIFSFKKILTNKYMKIGARINNIVVNTIPKVMYP